MKIQLVYESFAKINMKESKLNTFSTSSDRIQYLQQTN